MSWCLHLVLAITFLLLASAAGTGCSEDSVEGDAAGQALQGGGLGGGAGSFDTVGGESGFQASGGIAGSDGQDAPAGGVGGIGGSSPTMPSVGSGLEPGDVFVANTYELCKPGVVVGESCETPGVLCGGQPCICNTFLCAFVVCGSTWQSGEGLLPCFACGPDLSCKAAYQYCEVRHDTTTSYSCQQIPDACAVDRSCECFSAELPMTGTCTSNAAEALTPAQGEVTIEIGTPP